MLFIFAALLQHGAALRCNCADSGQALLDWAIAAMNGGAQCVGGTCTVESGDEGGPSSISSRDKNKVYEL